MAKSVVVVVFELGHVGKGRLTQQRRQRAVLLLLGLILKKIQLDYERRRRRRAHILVRFEHGVFARVLRSIRIQDNGVIELPQVNRGRQVERAVGAEQIGLDFLIVAIDERGAKPVAWIWTRYVQVDVLFIFAIRFATATASAYRLIYECFGQAAQIEIAWKCAIVRRYHGIGGVFEIALNVLNKIIMSNSKEHFKNKK